jgi:hypothetical protein
VSVAGAAHLCVRTLMRTVSILFIAFWLMSCGTTSTHQYPTQWPPLVGMSSDCREVRGTYIDLNVTHWEHVDQQQGVVTKTGGTLEAAWLAFGFVDLAALRLNDPNVKSRLFSISVDDADAFIIGYLIDGKVVSSKNFSKAQWSCEKDGLTITTLEKAGSIVDKIPSHGSSKRIATVYRVADQLYVKSIDTASIMLLHVVPEEDIQVRWYRFPARYP